MTEDQKRDAIRTILDYLNKQGFTNSEQQLILYGCFRSVMDNIVQSAQRPKDSS